MSSERPRAHRAAAANSGGVDRSPEAIRERAGMLLRETVADADADGVVVALSGGLDSATTAALAVDALGGSRVSALVMPTEANAESNTADARELAADLGIDHATVSLDPALDVFKRHVAPRIAEEGDEYAAGNLAARLRMASAYFLANANDHIVVGTSNRTERLLGYFTKYGDGGADVFPLGECDKTAVRSLAIHLGIPSKFVEKPPTAGFWKGQTDESDLGTSYETLDRVVRTVVGRPKRDDSPAIPGYARADDPQTVERLATRIAESAHKRTRPPSPSRRALRAGAPGTLGIDDARAGDQVGRLAEFVRQRVADADADGVVVALDGDLDSSVVAALAAEALGPERVHGLDLPCYKARGIDTADAGRLAADLDIEYDRVNVRPLVAELEAKLPTAVTKHAGTRVLGNFVTRVRMACAYYVANAADRLVLGTPNRSAHLLGYVTKYGDGAGDLRPLGGLYETEVRALGRRMGLPAPVVDKPSPTGFEVGQTAEEALGAGYETIDEILVRLVDRDVGIERTASDFGLERDTVRRYAALHAATRHKRSRPPTTGRSRDAGHFHELELKFE